MPNNIYYIRNSASNKKKYMRRKVGRRDIWSRIWYIIHWKENILLIMKYNKSKIKPLKQSETFLNGTLNLPTLYRLLPAPLPLQTWIFYYHYGSNVFDESSFELFVLQKCYIMNGFHSSTTKQNSIRTAIYVRNKLVILERASRNIRHNF